MTLNLLMLACAFACWPYIVRLWRIAEPYE